VEDYHHKVPLEEQNEAFDGCSHELHMHDKVPCSTNIVSTKLHKHQKLYVKLV
jgi:hypothetical protein